MDDITKKRIENSFIDSVFDGSSSAWKKFEKIKLKHGINSAEFKFYMDSMRTAYNKAVKEYMSQFNNLKLAIELAKVDFGRDIKALESGEILFDSKVPGFRRY